MSVMRAKLRVSLVDRPVVPEGVGQAYEVLNFVAVAKSDGYPEDGSDENNTFAKFTPTADLTMVINNPALYGKFEIDQEFYVDFTAVE